MERARVNKQVTITGVPEVCISTYAWIYLLCKSERAEKIMKI